MRLVPGMDQLHIFATLPLISLLPLGLTCLAELRLDISPYCKYDSIGVASLMPGRLVVETITFYQRLGQLNNYSQIKISESSFRIKGEIEVCVLCRNKIEKRKAQLELNLQPQLQKIKKSISTNTLIRKKKKARRVSILFWMQIGTLPPRMRKGLLCLSL